MRSRLFWQTMGVWMVFGVMAADAVAWGPEAKKAIMQTSMQLIRREYYQEYFQATDFKYGKDLLRGAEDGPESFLDSKVASTQEAVNVVASQIQLLRELRKYGVGGYFAYRLGALGSLVADLYLPYSLGLEKAPQAQELKRRIEADIDANVSGYTFQPTESVLQYMRSPVDYFVSMERQLTVEAAGLITADYASGVGYKGYLLKGGPVLFQKAVQAVGDTWNTILRAKGEPGGVPPSRQAVTLYLVDEVEYLLLVKKNKLEAEVAYRSFQNVNPGIAAAYERVGDCYYESNAKDRAVEEWKIALGLASSERPKIVKKLSGYYIEKAKDGLAKSEGPDAPERALDDALEALREALTIDRANQEAADLLAKTQVAKREKDERLRMVTEIMASAEKVMSEADRSADARLYEEAITTYQQVINLCEGVSDEFKTQKDSANEVSADAQSRIGKIMNQVLDDAQDAIDDGQAFVDQNMFDEAVAKYKSIEGILSVIPDDPSSRHNKTKQKLIEQAQTRIEEADKARRRYEEEQARLKNQPGGAPGAPGAARPAAAPTAAPAPAPAAEKRVGRPTIPLPPPEPPREE